MCVSECWRAAAAATPPLRAVCGESNPRRVIEQGSGGERLQRPAALGRVRFLHEDERLALLERRADLAEAVLVARAGRWVSRGECRGGARRLALLWGGVAGAACERR